MMTRLKIWLGMSFVRHLESKGFSVVPTLKWSLKKPTQPGWYWVRSTRLSARVEKFYEARHGIRSINPLDWPWSGRDDVFEYAGPVAMPEDAA